MHILQRLIFSIFPNTGRHQTKGMGDWENWTVFPLLPGCHFMLRMINHQIGDISLLQLRPFSAGKLPSLGLRMSLNLDPIQGGTDRRARQAFQRWALNMWKGPSWAAYEVGESRKVGFGRQISSWWCFRCGWSNQMLLASASPNSRQKQLKSLDKETNMRVVDNNSQQKLLPLEEETKTSKRGCGVQQKPTRGCAQQQSLIASVVTKENQNRHEGCGHSTGTNMCWVKKRNCTHHSPVCPTEQAIEEHKQEQKENKH